jgi:hypothetical protein
MYRVLLALAAAAVLPLQASGAAEPPPVTAATAVWTPDGHVSLTVTYDGGACEEPGEIRVESGQNQINVVTIPTVETAEICTLQIVPVTYEGVIAVEPSAETLSVTILDTGGQPKAAGSVEIKKSSEATAE